MARLDINVNVNGASKVKGLSGDLNTLEKNSNKAGQANKKLASSTDTATKSLALMGAAVAAVMVAKKVIAYADTYTLLNNRLALVEKTTTGLYDTQQKLFELSQKTSQSLEATTNLYTRLARATQEANVPQEELLTVTESVNNALKVSGASASESSAAITQLGQAMASGVLRGDEYNSIAENGSRITQMLADSLGVGTGKLREMASEGLITTNVMLKAFGDQAKVVSDEVSSMSKTVGQSFTELDNAVMLYIGNANTAIGATGWLTTAIEFATESVGFFAEKFIDHSIASEDWVKQNEKFIAAMRAGTLESQTNIEVIKASTDLRYKLAEALDITFESTLDVTKAEADYAIQAQESINVLDAREAASIANEIADIALYEAEAKLAEEAVNVASAISLETNEIYDNISAIDAKTAATQQLAAVEAAYYTEASWRNADGSLKDSGSEEGQTYTVTTGPSYLDQVLGGINSINDSLYTGDDSLFDVLAYNQKAVDDYNASLVTAVDVMDNFVHTFENAFINAIENTMSDLEDIYTTSSFNAISYNDALSNAVDMRKQLIANPLDVEIGEQYNEAYGQFIDSATAYLKDTNSFGSAQELAFAKATVGTQAGQFETTAMQTVDVLDSMNNFLASINAAYEDGILTEEEKAVISGVATDVNEKNEVLLGTSGAVVQATGAVALTIDGKTYYDNTGLATDSTIKSQTYYSNVGLATDANIDNQTYYDNTGLATTKAIQDEIYYNNTGLAKSTDIASQDYYDNTGLATDANINNQDYYDNTNLATNAYVATVATAVNDATFYDNEGLATSTDLTGSNSVSTFIKEITKGGEFSLGDIDAAVAAVETATGLNTVDLSNIDVAVGDVGLIDGTTVGIDGQVDTDAADAVSTMAGGKTLSNLIIKAVETKNNLLYSYWDPTTATTGSWRTGTTPSYDATQVSIIGDEGSTTTYDYFSQGGFTGNGVGQADQTGEKRAGIVHEGEWVAPKWMVNSNTELFRSLEGARAGKGFQAGGYTAPTGATATSTESGKITNQYLFVLADEIKKLHQLFRRLTDGGDQMRVGLVS